MSSSSVGRAHVRVPATSANLGPGYDALGLALQLYDDVTAEVIPVGLRITARGESAERVPSDESHLIVRAMRTTFAALDADAPGLSLHCINRIPHGRGLGSSAAAICAGVLLARQLVPGGADRVDDAGVLDLAARIEGHPDNIAACLLGGVSIAWGGGGDPFRALRLEPSIDLCPVVFIPSFESSTGLARQLLPSSVPHADAAFNAARAALLVATLTGDLTTLLTATEDRLHQPYRAPAMPAAATLVAELRGAGVAAVVSGAGPTVMALCASAAQSELALASAPSDWNAVAVPLDRVGAVVEGA